MGQKPVMITEFWAIHINKEDIISSLFIGNAPQACIDNRALGHTYK